MKHFEFKNSIAGAGGSKPKPPPPPTLRPPKLGDYSTLTSYAYSEVVDLLCDGPIEGLTNEDGYLLNAKSYLQGVYLNDTPVEVSNTDNVYTILEKSEADFGINNCIKSTLKKIYRSVSNSPSWTYFYSYQKRNALGGRSSRGRRTNRSYQKIYTSKTKKWYNKPGYTTLWEHHRTEVASAKGTLKSAVYKYGSATVNLNYQKSSDEKFIATCIFEHKWKKEGGTYRYKSSNPKEEAGSIDLYFCELNRLNREEDSNNSSYWQKYYGTTCSDSTNNEKKKTYVPNVPVIWEKQCTGNLGQNTFYTEFCFSLMSYNSKDNQSDLENDIIPILNPVNKVGRYRPKVDQAIDKLLEINSNPSYSRFQKEIIKEKLNDLGANIQTRNEDYSYDIEKEDILAIIAEKASFRKAARKLSSTKRNKLNLTKEKKQGGQLPYFFWTVDENYVIDGFDSELHENLFINPKYSEIEIFDQNKKYFEDDIFTYKGKYYKVVKDSYKVGEKAVESSPDINVADLPDIEAAKSTDAKANPDVPNDTPDILEINLDQPEAIWNNYFDFHGDKGSNNTVIDNLFDLIIPNLDQNGKWNGKVLGFNFEVLVESLFDVNQGRAKEGTVAICAIKNEAIDYYKSVDKIRLFQSRKRRSVSASAVKYNFSNVLAEFRNGNEFQRPLGYFKDIYIDHFYEESLIGPFSVAQINPFKYRYDQDKVGVQRLYGEGGQGLKKKNGAPVMNFDSNSIPDMDENFLIAYEETSKDTRSTNASNHGFNSNSDFKNFSDWDKRKDFNESASSITHIVQNPNVSHCFVSLWIKQLSDVFEDKFLAGNEKDVGAKHPGVVNIRVEVGYVDQAGKQTKNYDRFFQIVALVESPTILDIGSEEYNESTKFYKDVREVFPFNDSDANLEVAGGGVSTPFKLPPISDLNSTNTLSREDDKPKRYLKITKLSTETNSSLIKKELDLLKVTEIIRSDCNYPLSAIVGIKTDSRVFQSIPKRTYRCKLKKVKIPSNYFPLDESNRDKRYFNKKSQFDASPISSRTVYEGDWDGNFRFGWTDNPAWILYDMLSSPRYGLGDQISENQINKWDLYKIGRFCDAVDENGIFQGVDDGRGGIEPRFSCNIMFSRGVNVFDAINSISAIFRGVVFFENSSISFSDDRLKEPVALFTNVNVKDGFFSYSNYRRDEKFNAVEVSYKDRNDRFKSKIEYTEDEQDIIKRGLFKKEIVAAGITSKAMALRAAKHIMYQTTKENETVSFAAGIESLLLKPGDLIVIEDELKTLNNNFGRVLSVDYKNKTIRTSEKFNPGDSKRNITLYIPTGNTSKEELDATAKKERERLVDFRILGTTSIPLFDDNFAGKYEFIGYSEGYQKTLDGVFDDSLKDIDAFEQYAIYSGNNTSNPFIWFDTSSTGWVFSTGKSLEKSEVYNKFITSGNVFNFINLNDPISDEEISGSRGWVYGDSASNNRLRDLFSFSGQFLYERASDLDYVEGILESEIKIISNPLIRDFKITGWGGLQNIEKKDYGDIIYIDENDIQADLLKYVPEGTTYRFQSKNYSDNVYKIQTIKEQDNQSYNIIANKYDSGKYNEIENSIFREREEDVFSYDQNSFFVNDVKYVNLQKPSFQFLSTGFKDDQYYISGQWETIPDATGYKVIIESDDSAAVITMDTSFIYYTDGDYTTYTVKLKSLANKFNNIEFNTRRNDSDYVIEKIIAGNSNLLLESAQFQAGIIE